MATNNPASVRRSNRPTYSCVRCAERKVKCDRQQPCDACIKHEVQCVYRPPPQSRKKAKRFKHEAHDNQLKRLQQYEALLRDQGIDISQISSAAASNETCEHTPTTNDQPTSAADSSSPRPLHSLTKTQLIQSQAGSRLVDNSLWTRLAEEFNDADDSLDQSSQDGASDDSSSGDYRLDLAHEPAEATLHPSAEHIRFLWQTFVDNVDPLIKIVHVPALQPAIEKAIANVQSTPKSFEALLLAIYSTAILSLKNDDCEGKFNETRDSLLSRYTSATKAALLGNDLMGTTSLVMLQALVLHLISVRDSEEPRSVYVMTGVAVRIAESLGLHRDGATLGLSPYESEIRRRIWWQLKMHDYRAAELSGLTKFRGMDREMLSCEPPTNVNDDDLYPGMTSPAHSADGPTDMIFCALRPELGYFIAHHAARMQQKGIRGYLWDEDAASNEPEANRDLLKELEDMLESKYLRYCDPTKPLQLMTMLFARSVLNVGRFMASHPRKWANKDQVPDSERQAVWDISLSFLEQFDMMQSSRFLPRFSWFVGYYLQWHVFIHVLDTLRAKPLMPDALKAWRLVEATYNNNTEMLSNTKKPIHVAIGNLCLKAFKAREAAFAQEGRTNMYKPEFVAKLSQQRETAKARRQSRDAKNKRLQPTNSQSTTDINMMEVDINSIAQHTQRTSTGHQPTQYPITQSANFNMPNDFHIDNAFWSANGFDDGSFGMPSGQMYIDPDSMLLHSDSPWGGSASEQNIDWTQWDAWVGNSNMITTNFSAFNPNNYAA